MADKILCVLLLKISFSISISISIRIGIGRIILFFLKRIITVRKILLNERKNVIELIKNILWAFQSPRVTKRPKKIPHLADYDQLKKESKESHREQIENKSRVKDHMLKKIESLLISSCYNLFGIKSKEFLVKLRASLITIQDYERCIPYAFTDHEWKKDYDTAVNFIRSIISNEQIILKQFPIKSLSKLYLS